MIRTMLRGARRTTLTLAWFYSFFLISWFLLYLLLGDGSGFLGLANAVSIYFFLPLPLLGVVAIAYRQRLLIWPLLLGGLIFAWIWGPLFMGQKTGSGDGPELRVMSFNILGRAGDHQPILDAIEAEEADVLFLQELTPELAAILSVRLEDSYPFQILQPAPRSAGMGVLSRYPIESMDASLSGNWIGSPQMISMDWMGEGLTLVNFHTLPTGTLWPRWVRRSFERREADLQILADFSAQQSEAGPLIVAGDANVTQLNEGYKLLADVLQDVWMQAGRGLGHTFPGPIYSDSSYARISLFRLPHWLVRIDYIFASQQWHVQSAHLAEFGGGTDHRGVVTDLVLVD